MIDFFFDPGNALLLGILFLVVFIIFDLMLDRERG